MIKSEYTGPTEKTNNELLTNGVPKKNDKNNVKGKKRKKCIRDKTAPRPPHSGYIRFLNDRRDQFRAENPNLPFAEITKVLATEWNQLPADKKQQYLLAAEQERVKYVEELAAYRKTDAYRNFVQRKLKKKKINTPVEEVKVLEKEKSSNDDSTNSIHDIPIFTEEFLNFSKARESELRYLRKNVIDQEQEISVLDKHIENMNNGVIKLASNTEQIQFGNIKYEQYLSKLRILYCDALANIPLPDNNKLPTSDNIDEYITSLQTFLRVGTNPSLNSNVKKAVSKIDISL